MIVTGGKVGDLALHYANKYQLMIVRLLSKWDLRRLCKSIGATPLPKIVCFPLFKLEGLFSCFSLEGLLAMVKFN